MDQSPDWLPELGHASSVSDFVEQGLAEPVRALALLLEGALAVSSALLDGLLDLINSLWQSLFDLTSGLLDQTLEIPVLSWLFQQLTSEPLTFVNALLFVVAIQSQYWRWRVADGQWPSQSAQGASATYDLGAPPARIVSLLGLTGGV